MHIIYVYMQYKYNYCQSLDHITIPHHSHFRYFLLFESFVIIGVQVQAAKDPLLYRKRVHRVPSLDLDSSKSSLLSAVSLDLD
jgi:hypothetical protein